ncbi:MAG: hypothetical protein ACXWYJ_07370 [Actinomycetota bacterium]
MRADGTPRLAARLAMLLIGILAFAVAACTSAAVPPVEAPSSSPPRCPSYSTPRSGDRVRSAQLDEISGIVASPTHHVFWVQEDSGNPAVVEAIDGDGRLRATVAVQDAVNEDWEDIALADDTLWIGDIGDNDAERAAVQTYWFPEPALTASSVVANVLNLRYEDGPHDAEAMLVDADLGALYVITKLFRWYGVVYRADISSIEDGSSRMLRRVGTVPLGLVTAADSGPQGIVVQSYFDVLLYPWSRDRRVESTLRGTPCPVAVATGAEAIAIEAATGRLYTVAEGVHPSLDHIAPDVGGQDASAQPTG